MPWFRVDDGFALHPKALAAGNAALGLWVRAGSWSAQQLTEGFIPDAVVAVLGGKRKDAQALVAAGLWQRADGGYQFHQWEERQPTKEAVEAERDAARERQRKARERAKQQRDSQGSHGVTDAVTHGEVTPGVTVPPSLPIPSQPAEEQPPPSSEEPTPRRPQKRATAFPDGFEATAEMRDWAASTVPEVDIDAQMAQFRDHHVARGTAMKDWNAAWRTWMRNAQRFARRDNGPARPGPPGRSTTDQRVAQAQSLKGRFTQPPPRPADQLAIGAS